MSKRGELTVEEILGLILAAACIVLLLFLFWNMYSMSRVDKNSETAKSYFGSLVKELDIARKGGTGEFSMWQQSGEAKFYVVYFKEKIRVEQEGLSFNSLGNNLNRICVCYIDDDGSACKNCENLDYPVELEGNNNPEGLFIIKEKEKINIYKTTNENFYRFKQENE